MYIQKWLQMFVTGYMSRVYVYELLGHMYIRNSTLQWTWYKYRTRTSDLREFVTFTNFLLDMNKIHKWFRPVVWVLHSFSTVKKNSNLTWEL